MKFAHLLRGAACLAVLAATLRPAFGQSAFLRRPDIHGDRVVFTAEGDLWLGSVTDGSAMRLTSHPGLERSAHFSPDGSQIAFTAQYDGGVDVYVMPVTGGEPTRLTYDPAGALVLGWTPDGQNVLFRSRRDNPERANRLFLVPVRGGQPKLLPVPQGELASFNSDGKRLAYVPVSAEWQHWFHYRGGEADKIWLTDISTKTFKQLTHFAGVDTTPVWFGNQIYFISERDGIANLFKLDPNSEKVTAATHYADYECRYPATDGKRIVYQHGAGIAVYDPANGQSHDLAFKLDTDRLHARDRRLPLAPQVVDATIGPTGKRLLVEARGQILSVPVENGASRVQDSLPGTRSQHPAWSADGKQVAFISDRSGEEELWIEPSYGPGEPRQLTRDHKGPLNDPVWSPDGKWIAVSDLEMRLLLVDASTGEVTQVEQADRDGSYNETFGTYCFSPDSKLIAYSSMMPTWSRAIFLYDIASKRKIQITTAEMNSTAPAFDSTGKYLLFASDRDIKPLADGISNYFSYPDPTKISMVTLSADTPSPFILSNEEEGVTAKPEAKAGAKAGPADLDGIAERIIDIPMAPDHYAKLAMVDNRIIALAQSGDPGGTSTLVAFDIKSKSTTTLAAGVSGFEVSADNKKLLIHAGAGYQVVDAMTGPVTPASGRVDLSNQTVEIHPVKEWTQIFNETWRLARDLFYDPGMHGLNWPAIKQKYEAQLPAVGDRSDLNQILGDMIAELNIGHAYVNGGDTGEVIRPVPMGFLGADLEPVPGSAAYKIVKIFPSDGFDLDARSPLLAPGLNVHVGDYIVAIGGHPVSTDQDIHALLVGTANQTLSISVNTKPSQDGARQIFIKPMATEVKARYFDWAAGRADYVAKHGGANLGYVHIPDMSDGGLTEWAKHYPAQCLLKDGIVFDVRNNGGGYVSGYFLGQMVEKPFAWSKPRYGASWTRWNTGTVGYEVTLCNEESGSDAEAFADGFQRLKLGPVVGMPTWGGEVGSGNGYRLLDGGVLNIPNYGMYSPDGKWVIEGTGAEPDIVVPEDPVAVMAGRDPQLDRAIAYLKAEIAKRPIYHPNPPPFPVKSYNGGKMGKQAGKG
jgi:tricorn protease